MNSRKDLGDHSLVRQVFNLAMKELPGDATILLHAGKFEMEAGNLRRALVLLESGQQANPVDDYILHTLGLLHMEMGRRETSHIARSMSFNKANEYFEQKQRLDPFSPYSYVNHIELLLLRAESAGEQDDQEEYVRNAYELVLLGTSMVTSEDANRLVLCRTRVLDALGRGSLATEKLEEEMRSGGRPIAYELLGMRRCADGRFQEALDILREGDAKYPGNKRLLFQIIQASVAIATEHEGLKRALEAIQAYRGQVADNPIVNFHYGVVLFCLKRRDEARSVFEGLRQRASAHAGVFAIRTYARGPRGDRLVFEGRLISTNLGWRVLDSDSGQRFHVAGGRMGARGLAEGATLRFALGFSFAGPTAEVVA